MLNEFTRGITTGNKLQQAGRGDGGSMIVVLLLFLVGCGVLLTLSLCRILHKNVPESYPGQSYPNLNQGKYGHIYPDFEWGTFPG